MFYVQNKMVYMYHDDDICSLFRKRKLHHLATIHSNTLVLDFARSPTLVPLYFDIVIKFNCRYKNYAYHDQLIYILSDYQCA